MKRIPQQTNYAEYVMEILGDFHESFILLGGINNARAFLLSYLYTQSYYLVLDH